MRTPIPRKAVFQHHLHLCTIFPLAISLTYHCKQVTLLASLHLHQKCLSEISDGVSQCAHTLRANFIQPPVFVVRLSYLSSLPSSKSHLTVVPMKTNPTKEYVEYVHYLYSNISSGHRLHVYDYLVISGCDQDYFTNKFSRLLHTLCWYPKMYK